MSLLSKMKSIYREMTRGNGENYAHSVNDDMKFLNHFEEPENDFQRTYYQYLCQMWNDNDRKKYVLANIISLVLVFPFQQRFKKNAKDMENEMQCDNVMTMDLPSQKKFPRELGGECVSYVVMDNDAGVLGPKDILFLKELKKYCRSPYCYFKCMCRIAAYSRAIRIYNPKVIFCSAEYSFTSSVLTHYCEINNVKHVNIMHGEKIFDLTDAFNRFTEFYIWDNYYVGVFDKLRDGTRKYKIFSMDFPQIKQDIKPNRYTYYLQNETCKQIKTIKDALVRLDGEYAVRPHPLYSKSYIYEIFDKKNIVGKYQEDIWESIMKSKAVISANSTVLYQAYLLKKEIIIDNISNPELYQQLNERMYIMMSKPHKLLSDVIALQESEFYDSE